MKNNRLYKYIWYFNHEWEYRMHHYVKTKPLFNLMDVNTFQSIIVDTIPRIKSKWEFNAFKNLFLKYDLNVDNYIIRFENGYFYNKNEILFIYKIISDYIFKYQLKNGYITNEVKNND